MKTCAGISYINYENQAAAKTMRAKTMRAETMRAETMRLDDDW